MAESGTMEGIYPYQPSHVAPAILTALVGISLVLHTYQNFHYRFWRVTFFLFYAGIIFTIGWAVRTVASYNTSSLNLYIVQTVFILAGPPIYSATEYNILSRLMTYLPMHAPLHPRRVYVFFVYLGVAVESMTAAGASLIASDGQDPSTARLAGILISTSLLLQATIEILFVSLVAIMHHRCIKSSMLTPKIRPLIITLYGTSTLVLLRCIYRTIDSFATDVNSLASDPTSCPPSSFCHALKSHEWPLYVFEGAPIVIYTYWLNIMHPGRFLSRDRDIYLDLDGVTERTGPGWIDNRSRWVTMLDPFDVGGMLRGKESHVRFWEEPERWELIGNGGADGRRGKA